MLTTTEGFQFQSTLIIRDSTSDDFGYYGCAVTNSRGSAEASIYLEKQGIKDCEKDRNILNAFKFLSKIVWKFETFKSYAFYHDINCMLRTFLHKITKL